MGHAAVWRNLNGKCITFCWTGANEHAARLQAAQDLYELIFDIVRIDPTARLYFVAHSHGGNVVLKAIQLYPLGHAPRQTAFETSGRPCHVSRARGVRGATRSQVVA